MLQNPRPYLMECSDETVDGQMPTECLTVSPRQTLNMGAFNGAGFITGSSHVRAAVMSLWEHQLASYLVASLLEM